MNTKTKYNSRENSWGWILKRQSKLLEVVAATDKEAFHTPTEDDKDPNPLD